MFPRRPFYKVSENSIDFDNSLRSRTVKMPHFPVVQCSFLASFNKFPDSTHNPIAAQPTKEVFFSKFHTSIIAKTFFLLSSVHIKAF